MVENIVRFTSEDKSTFPYWFAHWAAFQMTALNMKCWKFKYLFHDIEKPWLKLFLPYKKVQSWHNKHNKHHLIYAINNNDYDCQAMIIDWECSRYTKQQSPLNAVEEYKHIFDLIEHLLKTGDNKENNNTCEYLKFILNKDYRLNAKDLFIKIRKIYDDLHSEFNRLQLKHTYNNDYLNWYYFYI